MVQISVRSAGFTMLRELEGGEEGPVLLALCPMVDTWGDEVILPGVVTERQEVLVVPTGWQYLMRCLAPSPPAWPQLIPFSMTLQVKKLVMAAGMKPPARMAQKGWLLLSSPDERNAIAELLLTLNGRYFLNHANHLQRERLGRGCDLNVELYRLLDQAGLVPEEVVFGPETLMQLYGLRRASYFDVLMRESVLLMPGKLQEISLDDVNHLSIGIPQFFENAQYHVVSDGLTFVSFNTARAFKQHRGSWRDRNDLIMMQALEWRYSCRLYLARWLDQGLRRLP